MPLDVRDPMPFVVSLLILGGFAFFLILVLYLWQRIEPQKKRPEGRKP